MGHDAGRLECSSAQRPPAAGLPETRGLFRHRIQHLARVTTWPVLSVLALGALVRLALLAMPRRLVRRGDDRSHGARRSPWPVSRLLLRPAVHGGPRRLPGGTGIPRPRHLVRHPEALPVLLSIVWMGLAARLAWDDRRDLARRCGRRSSSRCPQISSSTGRIRPARTIRSGSSSARWPCFSRTGPRSAPCLAHAIVFSSLDSCWDLGSGRTSWCSCSCPRQLLSRLAAVCDDSWRARS